jgi:hypothetical protein
MYYEVVVSDAAGNLGHNPFVVIFHEVLTPARQFAVGRDARVPAVVPAAFGGVTASRRGRCG